MIWPVSWRDLKKNTTLAKAACAKAACAKAAKAGRVPLSGSTLTVHDMLIDRMHKNYRVFLAFSTRPLEYPVRGVFLKPQTRPGLLSYARLQVYLSCFPAGFSQSAGRGVTMSRGVLCDPLVQTDLGRIPPFGKWVFQEKLS